MNAKAYRYRGARGWLRGAFEKFRAETEDNQALAEDIEISTRLEPHKLEPVRNHLTCLANKTPAGGRAVCTLNSSGSANRVATEPAQFPTEP